MKAILFFSFLVGAVMLQAQSGTQGDPYTALGHAYNVPVSGIYYFNIGGSSFSSYVEAGNGWILVASGKGSTTETSYAVTSNLTLQSDKILPSSIYNSSLITGVRMNATAGPGLPFDVQSNATAVLNRLRNDRTLSYNTNYTDWTGTGTDRLRRNCTGSNSSLRTHIYHACGLGVNMHWQVGQYSSQEKVANNNSDKNDLNLWMRAEPVYLPIELTAFTVIPVDRAVVLKWETEAEINNHYFTVERSSEGTNWEAIETIDGAGTTNIVQRYRATDHSPYYGTSYYRIRQTDFDGTSTLSPVKSVWIEEKTVRVYPNPVTESVSVEVSSGELGNPVIFSVTGQDMSHYFKVIERDEKYCRLDVLQLPPGYYFISLNGELFRLRKE